MGFLDAMIESSARFAGELLPVGYTRPRRKVWVINIDPDGKSLTISLKDMQQVPGTPADRTSGKVSPSLLVDKRSYALGIPDEGLKGNSSAIAQKEHRQFVDLLKEAHAASDVESLKAVYTFLDTEDVTGLPWPSGKKPKPGDLVTFQVGTEARWLTDHRAVQKYWETYIEDRLKNEQQACVLCGKEKAILRILPFKAKLFGYPVQVSSFNEDAFESGGKGSTTKGKDKKQASNAPICFACASTADQVLQHLLRLDRDPSDRNRERPAGRHAVILAQDNSKGKGKQPLRNQIAVFWTKAPVQLEPAEEGDTLWLEDLAKMPLDELDMSEEAPPPEAQQMRTLMERPFRGGSSSSDEIATNSFYLAVLSPNKSRLVVREWLEQDVGQVSTHIAHYARSLRITHPDARGIWYPPLRSMLESLRSYTSNKNRNDERPRLPQVGPDITRKLLRCIYTGTAPPGSLLARAVRCFRVPDTPADGKAQYERQALRRMALVATMKLVLTYDRSEKEQRAMEQLKTPDDHACDYKKQAPYRCGQMLAILEAAQRRASSSGRGVNSTLVDRFYGGASTAPAAVFANLINMATKAHLPKLRREGREFFRVRSQEDAVNINDLMMGACDAINEAGGFPPPLTPEQQAQFALGFYHQRAELNPPRVQASGNNMNRSDTPGGQS